jgi:nucleotide-binding universal stress UspA family protein
MTANVSRKIVVGFDGSEAFGEQVLADAFELARREGHVELHVIQVIQPVVEAALAPAMALTADKDIERLRTHLQEAVQAEIARQGELKVAAVVAHVAIGSPAYEIVDLASRLDADMIVVGTHGRRGLGRAFLGSVAEHVVRLAGCPVIVTRPKAHVTRENIPQIEPLCPDCAKARAESKGETLWCARHSEHHPRAHVYSYEAKSSEPARPWGFHG